MEARDRTNDAKSLRESGARPFERNAPYAPTPDNRPAALTEGRLALTREHRSQMSFGERAAVEGILAQLRPRIALEIGTAEGGSLDRVAAYSEVVHSIDVDHGPVAGRVPPNARLHTGPSATVLPLLLERLAAAGEVLDFVLVDGDHSFDGVSNDLRLLLDAPAVARSVILVHDTMNAEVRAGIESVRLDDYRPVVYYELDFVPGYVYRTGAARNSAWGGLGLILTDQRRSAAYAASPRQSLYHEPFDPIHRMRAELIGAAPAAR